MGDRTSLTLGEGMRGMSENVFMNIKNRSVTITADVDIPPGGANGVILAQGGRVGGFSLYFKNGKPVYHYNYLGMERFTVASTQAVPAGKATPRVRLRRGRSRQGWPGHDLRERQKGGRRPDRE